MNIQKKYIKIVIILVILGAASYFNLFIIVQIIKTTRERKVEIALRPLLSIPEFSLIPQEVNFENGINKQKTKFYSLIIPENRGTKILKDKEYLNISNNLYSLFIQTNKVKYLDGDFGDFLDSALTINSPHYDFEASSGMTKKKDIIRKAAMKMALVHNFDSLYYSISDKSGAFISVDKDFNIQMLWWPHKDQSRYVVIGGRVTSLQGAESALRMILGCSVIE